MRISRIVYRLSSLNPVIEFLSILAWMLFCPKSGSKESAYIYFLVTAVLLVLWSIRNIVFLKNIALSCFSSFLAVFNLVLIVSIFFSVYHFSSIYFYADILLVSFYFILFFYDKSKKDEYFHYLAYLLSLFSLLNIVHYILLGIDKPGPFFTNPILQGIACGAGVLITLYYILKKFDWIFLILLLVNSGGVFVSRSKAAFIGVILFALLLVILQNKKLIVIPAILAVLTFIIPNPIKDAFYFSIKKDPYAYDRVHIWQAAIDIFKDHPLTGVGPENFAEVSKKYNFKQTRGPANYFKVPRQTHNDYLKLLAETGLPGLLMLALLLFFIFRKIFSSSLFDITRILLLYLLFQAFFFNIIFHVFFLFLFIFLAKILFEQEPFFRTFHFHAKFISIFSLLFVFTICYLFPLLSNMSIEKAKKKQGPVETFNLLKKAAYLNPLNIEPFYLEAFYFMNYFKQTADLEYFGLSLESIKEAQRLNRHFTPAYILESDLYYSLFDRFKSGYVSVDEIVSPISRAEKFAPYDPFIKLRKAEVYLQFGRKEGAKKAALSALEVEPEFISALYFLQRNFNYFKDESIFQAKFKQIKEKIKRVSRVPGSYLYELYKIPEELK